MAGSFILAGKLSVGALGVTASGGRVASVREGLPYWRFAASPTYLLRPLASGGRFHSGYARFHSSFTP